MLEIVLFSDIPIFTSDIFLLLLVMDGESVGSALLTTLFFKVEYMKFIFILINKNKIVGL